MSTAELRLIEALKAENKRFERDIGIVVDDWKRTANERDEARRWARFYKREYERLVKLQMEHDPFLTILKGGDR